MVRRIEFRERDRPPPSLIARSYKKITAGRVMAISFDSRARRNADRDRIYTLKQDLTSAVFRPV